MPDLNTMQQLFNRAGWHAADKLDETAYTVTPIGQRSDDLVHEDCVQLGCAIELTMTGSWTGEFTAHFSSDGTILHVWVYGD